MSTNERRELLQAAAAIAAGGATVSAQVKQNANLGRPRTSAPWSRAT